jgi:hypothetical protein
VKHTKEVYKNWLGEPELSLITGDYFSELGDVNPFNILLDKLAEDISNRLQNGGDV